MENEEALGDLEDVLVGCTPPKVKNVQMENSMEIAQSTHNELPIVNHEWRGVSLESLKIFDLESLYPPVKPSNSHTVLFKVPVVLNQLPDPYPRKPLDVWDKDHVRLPCSSHCLSPISETDLRNRWDLIQEAFSKPIKTVQELEDAILHYNSKYADRWNFKALHRFFSQTLLEEETEYFFSNVLPGIVHLALSLPQVLTGGIPLLRQKQTHSVSLTQRQIASLLANAFLCTFPRRNTFKSDSEYKNYPDINFNRLYSFEKGSNVQEKLKCLVNYFRRVCVNCPDGVVTYSRHYVSSNNLPVWSESTALMPHLHVTSVGSIEDEGTGMMELDFANKFVGGGVLKRGCVQEEIRFVICPELIVARLFTEALDDTEALIVAGIERYNCHKGYSSSFTWAGDFKDHTPRDSYGRRLCVLVAVDASKFRQAENQYSPSSVNRELNKAFAGFSWGVPKDAKQPRLSVATGNWGCGAFGGNAYLKALLQLMVAGHIRRNVAYFTFGDPDLRDKLGNLHKFLVENKVTVGHLWKLLYKFHNSSTSRNADLYNFIFSSVTNGYGASKSDVKLVTHSKVEPKSINLPQDKASSYHRLTSQEIDETLASLEDDCTLSVPVGKEPGKCDLLSSSELNCSKSKPISAKSYSVKSKEGRDMCLQRQKDSWARIEESKKDFNEFEIVDDDPVSSDTTNSSKSNISKEIKQSPVVKRKISDYFSTTPKV